MMASQELLGYVKQLTDLEADFAKLSAEERLLYTNETGAALGASIAKCEEEKLNIHYLYQDLLKKVAISVQRDIRSDAEDIMQAFLNLQMQYFSIVDWLCKQQYADGKSSPKTYWEQFQRDNRHQGLWHCTL